MVVRLLHVRQAGLVTGVAPAHRSARAKSSTCSPAASPRSSCGGHTGRLIAPLVAGVRLRGAAPRRATRQHHWCAPRGGSPRPVAICQTKTTGAAAAPVARATAARHTPPTLHWTPVRALYGADGCEPRRRAANRVAVPRPTPSPFAGRAGPLTRFLLLEDAFVGDRGQGPAEVNAPAGW